MIFVIGMFAFVTALIVGAYWLFVVRPEEQQHAAVRKRVAPSAKQRNLRRELIKQFEERDTLSALDQKLAKTRVAGSLRQLIEQSGVQMNVAGLLVLSFFCGLVGFFIAIVTIHWVLVALAVALLFAFAPFFYVRRKRASRIRKFEEHFPEAIDLIARALRAGHAFPSGIAMVAEEMAPPIGPEFQVLYEQQNVGMPLAEALRAFAARIPLLDAKFFATAVLTQREAGGNLAEVLDNLATVIRDRFKVKRQVRVISAHGRITGWVLVGLPPSLAAMLTLIAPKHMAELFTTSIGHYMLLAAITLQVVGSLIIRKLVQIEY